MFTLEAGRLPVPSPWGAASQRGSSWKAPQKVASAVLEHIREQDRDGGEDREEDAAREGGRERERESGGAFNPIISI